MEDLLQIRNLTKCYGGVAAVDGVDFTIRIGQTVGLIGPNGAGKTTLFNMVSGFGKPDSGRVRWKGIDITSFRAHRRAKLGLVRTFQQARVFRDLSVRDNLVTACHLSGDTGFFRDIVGTRRARLSETQGHARATEIIEQFGLQELAELRGRELSYGQAKRVALIVGIVCNPTMLLLDEPAAGLNRVEISSLQRDLELLRGLGMTLCLVEHDMGLVMELCSRVVVLDAGRKIADGTPSEVMRDPEVIAAYLGVMEDGSA